MSGTSQITHHTSHITEAFVSFTKILVINTLVHFSHLSKLIMQKYYEHLLMEIIALLIQTPMSSLKLAKPTISQWNKTLSEKSVFPQKSRKSSRLVVFFKFDIFGNKIFPDCAFKRILICLKENLKKSYFKKKKKCIIFSTQPKLSYWQSLTICWNWSWTSLPTYCWWKLSHWHYKCVGLFQN